MLLFIVEKCLRSCKIEIPENKPEINKGYMEAQNKLFEAHPEMENPAFWDEGAPKPEIPQAIVDEYDAMLDEDDE